MYTNIKSCVSIDGEQSDFFMCNCGVRQGENLSPVLFSLFLNDLEDYLESLENPGIQIKDNSNDLNQIIRVIYSPVVRRRYNYNGRHSWKAAEMPK